MKKWFLGALLLLFSQFCFSQAWSGTGDQKLQFGLGAWGNGTGITGTYDYGLSDLISVGGGANFYFDNHDDDDDYFIFGRLNFHLQKALNLPSNWDIYPGADIGVLGNTFGLGVHLGARYFFNDKFGAFVEAGNNGSIGISINL
ncbi:DUF6646 family protein [Weeksellaceae bacterium A-14]